MTFGNCDTQLFRKDIRRAHNLYLTRCAAASLKLWVVYDTTVLHFDKDFDSSTTIMKTVMYMWAD